MKPLPLPPPLPSTLDYDIPLGVAAVACLVLCLLWLLSRIRRRPKPQLPAMPQVSAAPPMPEAAAGPPWPTLNTMDYQKYLKTPEWTKKKEVALAAAGYRCQLDMEHSSIGLEVHHRTYDRRGYEWPSDLIVLCRACHAKHHGKPP
jgi:hypothetical protein